MQPKKKHYFDVSSADWSIVVSADSPTMAAKKALAFMMKARESNVNLSFAICVKRIFPENPEEDLLKTVDILRMLGKTKEADSLQEIAESYAEEVSGRRKLKNVAKW